MSGKPALIPAGFEGPYAGFTTDEMEVADIIDTATDWWVGAAAINVLRDNGWTVRRNPDPLREALLWAWCCERFLVAHVCDGAGPCDTCVQYRAMFPTALVEVERLLHEAYP